MMQRIFNLMFVSATLLSLLAACDSLRGDNLFRESDGESDAAIRAYILGAWRQSHPDISGLDVDVSSGTVILTGALPARLERVEAVKLAWQPSGVKGVVNEIKVPASDDPDLSRDTACTIRLRARLTFDMDVESTNYSIETIDGTVYLAGRAKSQDEISKVQHLAESACAAKAVSYVTVGQTPPKSG